MPLPYIPPQAYDQELADAFRVRYQLADQQRSIRRLRSLAGHSPASSYAPFYGNTIHDPHAWSPILANRVGADVLYHPQYQSLPPTHLDFIGRSPYYSPVPLGTQPYPYVTAHQGTPNGPLIGSISTWPSLACPAWQPAASAYPTPHSRPPPHASAFRDTIPSSPSSTSQSSTTNSEVSNTPEPEPLLTAEEFLQTLHRLELDGRGGQAPIARFRLQGEPMHVSVSRPHPDGPFVIKHYNGDGREDGISVAHILPGQGGVVWCPPPRMHCSIRDSGE